jgi:hypothetical protein
MILHTWDLDVIERRRLRSQFFDRIIPIVNNMVSKALSCVGECIASNSHPVLLHKDQLDK